MAVVDTFSKRLAVANGLNVKPQIEMLPEKFRVQVVHILHDLIGRSDDSDVSRSMWTGIEKTVAEEQGKFYLGNHYDAGMRCCDHVMRGDRDEVLDLIEVAFRRLQSNAERYATYRRLGRIDVSYDISQAIQNFNQRCLENGVAFRFVGGRIVPAASEFTHAVVVEPALTLLHDQGFEGAHDEFMQAFKHLRGSDYKAAIIECSKAFESAMKTICRRKGLAYQPGDTAKRLLDTLFDSGHIPPYMQHQFNGIRSVLEAGVPTVRNKTSAHGQGETTVEVPRPVAEYALHVTAANILLLANLP